MSTIAIAGVGAFAAGTFAADFDPTGQAGQYELERAATLVRGEGGLFNNVRIWVPWLLDEADAQQNSAVVEIDAEGLPAGAVTTFGAGGSGNVRMIAAFGTTDAATGGTSNNVFIDEGSADRSNAFGVLLPDGTAMWRSNFDFETQNNLEFMGLPWPDQTAIPQDTGLSSVFSSAFGGIGDGEFLNENGSVFLGTPGAEWFNGELYSGVTTFDGGSGAVPVGTNVYVDELNDPNQPLTTWLQIDSPAPDDVLTGDIRQTQPRLKNVDLPCGDAQLHIAFGVGVSGTSFTGGASRPQLLVIDQVNSSSYGDGFAFIDADGDGDFSTGDNNLRFIDHQATGGGTGPVFGSLFDINDNGEIAVLWEDRSGQPDEPIIFEVRLYRPIVDQQNCRITGYLPPIVIARTGEDGIVGDLNGLIPFSGVSIDDDGRIAFVGVSERFPEGQGEFEAFTSTLYVWEPMTETLHAVVSGGQTGDTLADAFGDGPDLMLGQFPVFASDTFIAEGLSETGGCLAVVFRSGVENSDGSEGFDFNGGVLNPGDIPNEQAVRGVVTIQLGQFTMGGIPGDIDGDGDVDIDDLLLLLAAWGTSNPDADIDGNGTVDVDDLLILLSNWS
jgi:hypothetical protein